MEIQTFFLCGGVAQNPDHPTDFDAVRVGAHTVRATLGAVFPLRARLPFFLLLRRSTRMSGVSALARIRWIDADGRPQDYAHTDYRIDFPDGERFASTAGDIPCHFPAPGDYRLEIVVVEDGQQSLFWYDVEVLTRQTSEAE